MTQRERLTQSWPLHYWTCRRPQLPPRPELRDVSVLHNWVIKQMLCWLMSHRATWLLQAPIVCMYIKYSDSILIYLLDAVVRSLKIYIAVLEGKTSVGLMPTHKKPSSFSGLASGHSPGRNKFNPATASNCLGGKKFNPGTARNWPGRNKFNPGTARNCLGGNKFNQATARNCPGRNKFNPGTARNCPGKNKFNPGTARNCLGVVTPLSG